MTFALANKMQTIDDTDRVKAFDNLIADWCKLAEEERQPKPDVFEGMKFSLDMDERILTCSLADKQAKLSLASVDPYLFLSLTVGEIIDAAKQCLLKALDKYEHDLV